MTRSQAFELAISHLEGREDCLTSIMHLRRAQLAARRDEYPVREFDPRKEALASVALFVAITIILSGFWI